MTSISPTVAAQVHVQTSKSKNENSREIPQAFETMFLSQVIDEMMKTVDLGPTMGDHAAEMWQSVISEALANNLMENGGLGIADSIQQKIDAYQVHTGGKNEQS